MNLPSSKSFGFAFFPRIVRGPGSIVSAARSAIEPLRSSVGGASAASGVASARGKRTTHQLLLAGGGAGRRLARRLGDVERELKLDPRRFLLGELSRPLDGRLVRRQLALDIPE